MKLLLGVCLLFTSLFAQSAVVVSGGEGWTVDGEKLRRQQLLTHGREMKSAASSELLLDCTKNLAEPLLLVYRCAQASVVRVCDTSQSCSVRKMVPEGFIKRWSGMFAALFIRESAAPVTLGVRAAGNVTDSVVRQEGDRVAWAPALARVLEGKHCFQLSALPSDGKVSNFMLDWDPEDAAKKDGVAPLPGLKSGTYTLRRGAPGASGSCQIEDPDAAPAWVLVTPAASFERIRGEWESNTPALEKLAQDASPAVAATLRHALLASLADSIGKN